MKQLKDIILEKLIMSTPKKVQPKYFPKDNEELKDIIYKLYDKDTEYIDARHIDVSEIENFNEIFEGYKNVKSINLTGWDVSKGLTFDSMFLECGNLENIIGIDDFVFNDDRNNKVELSFMFFTCKSLKNIDISEWDISNVKFLNGLFWGCHSLETPGDLSNWNTSNVISMSFMFNQCYKLQTIGDVSNWKFNNLSRIDRAFHDCRELKSLGDISKWNVSTINIVAMMFQNCKKLIADCSKWKFKNTVPQTSIKSAFLKTNTKKLLRPKI